MLKRLDIYEDFAAEVSDLIAAVNDEGISYDNWACISSKNRLDEDFGNMVFTFDYDHDDHKGIQRLEKRMYTALFKNRKHLTALILGCKRSV